MKNFNKIHTESREINQIQQNIKDAVDSIVKNPLLDGVLVHGINLTASQNNEIAHTLSRNVIGWIVVDQNAQAQIWRGQASSSRFVNLLTSNNVTVSVYFF